MKTSTIVWAIVVILIIAGGAWYFISANNASGTPTGSEQTTDTSTDTSGQTTSATVLQASTDPTLGSFLSSPVTGMTLYTYSPDTPGVSNCSGQCAVNWPPYLVQPGITLLGAAGVNGQLGTITRAEGGTQLTYNGAPLYTYIKDTKPGDTVGQGVGGVWYIVTP